MKYGVLFFCCISFGASAAVHETLDYRYYEVPDPAQTGQSLTQSLDEATPFATGDRSLHGRNHWSVRWQIETRSKNDQCAIESVSVDLDTLITLPELVSEKAGVQKRFNTYVKALQRHLVAHYIVAIQATNAIDIRLLRLDPAEDCQALEAAAKRHGDAIVAEHRRKEKAFDASTDYGAEQGVVLDEE